MLKIIVNYKELPIIKNYEIILIRNSYTSSLQTRSKPREQLWLIW